MNKVVDKTRLSLFKKGDGEQFRAVFMQDSENEASLSLIRWISMAAQSKVKPLINFARGISCCFKEVLNGIRHKINSAKIESLNAGIKRIQSECCGIYDINYLFLKHAKSITPPAKLTRPSFPSVPRNTCSRCQCKYGRCRGESPWICEPGKSPSF